MLRPLSGEILTPPALLEYCHDYVQRGISFEFLDADDMQKDRLWLALRFLLGSTILGSRLFQEFEPLTNFSTEYKRTSEDSSLTGIHYFSYNDDDDLKITGNDSIACKYNGRWWLGLFHSAGCLCEVYASTRTIICFFFGHKRLMHVGFHFMKFYVKSQHQQL